MKDVHVGKLVQTVFQRSGLKMTAFADRMETTRQNVYKIFQRESLSTDLLFRLSEELDYDFFLHLSRISGSGDAELRAEEAHVPYGEGPGMAAALRRELQAAHDRIQILQDQVHDKDEIIELMRFKVKTK